MGENGGVKLIIPNEPSDEFIAKMVSGGTDTMLLTPDNIEDVVDNPDKYQGYTFLVSGRSIDVRKSMSVFNRLVVQLIKRWRHLGWSIFIITSSDCEDVMAGLLSIDKLVRAYVLDVRMSL